MDQSINPIPGPQNNPFLNSSSNQEPPQIIQDVLTLMLIFSQGVEWTNDNDGGNCSTGQMMAQAINDLVKQISAEVKNGTASLADQVLLQNLTSGTPSLATLANNIVTAANKTPATIDTTDIQSMLNIFLASGGPGPAIINELTNSSDSMYWFSPNNTNLGNSLAWSGDSSELQFWMSTFMNEMGPLINGMQNPNNTFAQQVADAKEYAGIVENLYSAMKSFPNNPFVQTFMNYMNTLVPGQGSATLIGFMNVFSQPSFTPTPAELQTFINILEPGGGNSNNNGFQAILSDLLSAMTNNGMFNSTSA